jgi:hypothetical protein
VQADIGDRTHTFASDCRDAGIGFSVGYEIKARLRKAMSSPVEN